MKSLFLLVPALFLVASATAQETGPEDPVPSPLIERDEVRFITLDLSVEEKQGRRWRQALGLRQDQVTVEVGGSPITLDVFEDRCRPGPVGQTTSPGADAAPGEPRDEAPGDQPVDLETQHPSPPLDDTVHYILYFDFTHLMMEGFHLSIKAALEWTDKQARPEDEVMIVTGGRGLRIFRPLWPARDRLREDILALKKSGPMLESWAWNEDGRGREILNMPTRIAAQNLANSYASVDFQYTRNSLENLEGLMTLFESVEGTKNLIFFQETVRQLPGGAYPMVSILSDVNPFLQNLATAANERNVRIYPVHASGMSTGPGGADNALSMLASETGGKYIFGTNRIATVLDKAGEDAACVYRAGFRVRPRFSGNTERIVVNIEGGRYRVRHRRKLHDPTRSERDRDQLQAAFLDPDAAAAFPVHPSVSTLYADSAKGRVRFQVSAARDDLLDLAAGATGTEARQVRVQIGGTVIPLAEELADGPTPLRPQAWIDADPEKTTWSFARQSVLRLSPGDHEAHDVVLVQEAELPVGKYRLVAVVQDQLSRTVSAGMVDFAVEPLESSLGIIRLATTNPMDIHIEPHADEAPEELPGKRKVKPRALPASLPVGSILSEDTTLRAGRPAWLVYSLCEHLENGNDQPFTGWSLERTLICNDRPAPSMTAAIESDSSSDCVVVVDPLPADLDPGSCRTEVTLERPGVQSETQSLAFQIEDD